MRTPPKSVTGRVLTAAFDGASLEGDALEVKMPAKSVVVLVLKLT